MNRILHVFTGPNERKQNQNCNQTSPFLIPLDKDHKGHCWLGDDSSWSEDAGVASFSLNLRSLARSGSRSGHPQSSSSSPSLACFQMTGQARNKTFTCTFPRGLERHVHQNFCVGPERGGIDKQAFFLCFEAQN